MKKFIGFEKGMGIGGWLTNYKRFQCIRPEWRNLFTAGDVEHFNTYIKEDDVKYISEMGFDHIRICFDQIVVQNAEGSLKEENVVLIDKFICWCEKYNLNVVLNLHKAIGNYCDVDDPVSLLESERLQKNFIRLWLDIEKRYSTKKGLVFELLNEVKWVEPEKWNSLAEKTISEIRKLNSDRKIIVGCMNFCNVDQLSTLKIFNDENIIYTFHYYKPEEFTHQRSVLREPEEFYNRDIPYPDTVEKYDDYQKTVWGRLDFYKGYNRIDKQWIYDSLKPVKQFINNHPDKILWCGEFGTIRHARLSWRIAWFKDVISFFKENGIPYSVWNYLSTPNDGNKFSLVDDDNRHVLSEDLRKVLLGDF